jgi:HMG (high mobility group) box
MYRAMGQFASHSCQTRLIRFVREKAAYKGPWSVPKRRAKKHPLAPKRPMSAFLKYSQKRRSVVKKDNPDMSNTDVSRLLGEMWRNASRKEREPYVLEEEKERAIYKEEIKNWRDEQAKLDAASRTSHKTVQKMAAAEAYPLPARQIQEEASLPNTFDQSLRLGTVEDAAERADQRMVFRHSFGTTPLPPYRPSYGKEAFGISLL